MTRSCAVTTARETGNNDYVHSKTANPRRVVVLTYPGVSLFEFSVACEVFGTEDWHESGYRLVVCGDDERVRCDVGIELAVPRTLAAIREAHTLVLPPCDDPDVVSDATLRAIRRAHARGVRIVSLCTGAFVLARTGLLDGRRAVTHWDDLARFERCFPTVALDPGVLYVDDGDVLTSAGSAASIDLCLYLVRCDLGADAANRIARRLVVQPHRDGGQAQFIDAPMPADVTTEPLADTLTWMTEHLDEDVSVEDLAARINVSPRSFARHFAAATGSTPYQWLLRQRVQQAQRILETSGLPVELIAARVGLGNATNLRKHFRRQLGTSPAAYRRAFGAAS
jgi:AraC family transcriptional regulator, transcriptional activator FtrA